MPEDELNVFFLIYHNEGVTFQNAFQIPPPLASAAAAGPTFVDHLRALKETAEQQGGGQGAEGEDGCFDFRYSFPYREV